MPNRTRLNFQKMVQDFLDVALPGSQRIRERSDAISRLIIDLAGSDEPGDPPDAPDGLGAVGLEKSVQLTWLEDSEAATFRVYRADNVAGPFTQVAETTEALYLDVGLADLTQYFYYVTAVALNLLESDPSEITDATTLADSSPQLPTVPTGLAAVAESSRSVRVSWDALTGDSVAVLIERRRPSASVPTWVTVADSTIGTDYLDERVNQNLTYEYRIAALNAAGAQSAFTSEVSVTTPAEDTTPPSVPEGLSLTPGDGFITAECDPSPEPDTRGYIFGISSTTGAPYSFAPERTETSITFPNLTNDTEYFVVVKAIDTSDNESALSSEQSATVLSASTGDTTPPPAVTTIGSGSEAEGSIKVVWGEVTASDLAGYAIEVSLPPAGSATGPWTSAATAPAGTAEWTFTGLDSQENYSYRVLSFDTTGNQAAPSPVVTDVPDGAEGPAGTVTIRPAGEPVGEPGGGPSMPGGDGDENSPTEGITTDGTKGSTVLQYHYLSLDEKKNLFYPGMRGARAARPTNQNSSQYQRDTCPSLSNINFVHSAGAGIAYGTGQPPTLPRTERPDGQAQSFVNCGFTDFASSTNGAPKWAIQDYCQPASFNINCDFESVATGPFGYWEPPFQPSGDQLLERYPRRVEHDRYSHTSRPVIWKGCTSFFVGGHCVYVANRPFSNQQYAPDNTAADRASIIWVDNCHLIDSNIGPSKGTNKVEIFDFGIPTQPSHMVIRNSSLIDHYPFWVRPVGGNAVHESLTTPWQQGWGRGKGLINVSGFQYCENPQQTNASGSAAGYDTYNSPGGFGAGPCFMAAALIKNCILGVSYPLRNICGFGGVQDVIFEDCTFVVENGTRTIVINENAYKAGDPTGFDHPTRGLPRTQTISFANCLLENVRITFKRLAGNDLVVTVPSDLRNLKITYDCSDGSIVGGAAVAYDPTADFTDPALWVNASDPLNGVNGIPSEFSWGVPGVTV